MEGVPSNISYEQVKKSILEVKGVQEYLIWVYGLLHLDLMQ